MNELLDTMHQKINVGDKIAYIHKSGFYGKSVSLNIGIVTKIDPTNELCKIKTDTGSVVTRKFDEIITIYDLLEKI